MSRVLPLSGWTLVSLRPQNQHTAVRRAAREQGGRVIAASACKLTPVPSAGALESVLACPVRIASSPNAVRFAGLQSALFGDWLAVGNSTAGALMRAGAGSVRIPELQTTDGLLKLDVLQSVRGQRIGLLTAPDGRGLLEQELPERGAQLIIANSYQRQPSKLSTATRQRIIGSGPDTALLVTSQRAFQQFFDQFDAAAQHILKSRTCIASSLRLLEYLQALGFVRVLLSRSTLPKDTLQVLADAIARARAKELPMSDAQPMQPTPRSTTRIGVVLFAVGLLAALAYFGYDRLRKPQSVSPAETLDLSAEALDRRLLVAEQALAAIQNERRNLQQRVDESSNRTNQLRDEMLDISERAALIEDSVRALDAGGRNVQESIRVNEAELLLSMSRERWLLSGDLSGTIHALELAASAISGLKDPQWLNLRQTMAQELGAFRAIETDPRAVARGELDALEGLLPQLPKPNSAASAIVSSEPGFKRLFNALVQIQPTGQQNLISPSERQAAQTALLLEISNARMALQLRQDAEYKRSVRRIDQWLMRLYAQTPVLKEQRERLRDTATAALSISVPLSGSSLLELQRLKQEAAP